MQPGTRGPCKRLHRAGLVEHEVVDFLRRDFHQSAAKPGEVGQARVCADGDAVVGCQPHGLADSCGVAGVETRGDVG